MVGFQIPTVIQKVTRASPLKNPSSGWNPSSSFSASGIDWDHIDMNSDKSKVVPVCNKDRKLAKYKRHSFKEKLNKIFDEQAKSRTVL